MFLAGFVVGVVTAVLVAWVAGVQMPRLRPRQAARTGPSDEALLVSFLADHGASATSDIRLGMEHHTRGEHDWFSVSDRRLYRMLERLVSDGAVVECDRDIMGRRRYALRAEPTKLVAVK